MYPIQVKFEMKKDTMETDCYGLTTYSSCHLTDTTSAFKAEERIKRGKIWSTISPPCHSGSVKFKQNFGFLAAKKAVYRYNMYHLYWAMLCVMIFTDIHITSPCYTLCEYTVVIVQ